MLESRTPIVCPGVTGRVCCLRNSTPTTIVCVCVCVCVCVLCTVIYDFRVSELSITIVYDNNVALISLCVCVVRSVQKHGRLSDCTRCSPAVIYAVSPNCAVWFLSTNWRTKSYLLPYNLWDIRSFRWDCTRNSEILIKVCKKLCHFYFWSRVVKFPLKIGEICSSWKHGRTGLRSTEVPLY